LNVRDDTEIDWKTLPDRDWNLWSPHSLQRRWLTLKKGIKGYEEMTHQGLYGIPLSFYLLYLTNFFSLHTEIMDILRVKKAHFPAPPFQNKRKKVTSAAAVTDSDNGATPLAEAGSSNGPGTLEAVKGNDAQRKSADAEDYHSSD
jgi:hypothetical protein